MIAFERKVEKIENSGFDEQRRYCQASINSNGNITLRGFSNDDETETMTILDNEETRAIFELFNILQCKNSLPF